MTYYTELDATLAVPPYLSTMGLSLTGASGVSFTNSTPADAANEGLGMVGYMKWADGGNHAISGGGGAKLGYRTASASFTWADAGTNLRIGVQDVSSGIPDGTFDVYADLVPGTDAQATDTIYEWSLATGSSKTINHGQLVALCFQMTARGGSDAFRLRIVNPFSGNYFPGYCFSNSSGVWSQSTGNLLNLWLIADDGTYGIIRGAPPFPSSTIISMSTSSPDERGIVFAPTTPRKIDALIACVRYNSASMTGTLNLIKDPYGTPSVMESLQCNASDCPGSGTAPYLRKLASEHELIPSVQYAVTYRCTAFTGYIGEFSLANANMRPLYGLTGAARIYRHGGSGTFTEESTTSMPLFGAFASQLPAISVPPQGFVGIGMGG